MRVLMLDLDTLRPDHLGCYGYHRDTSPTLDSIAADGMRFENYHCSDAPCLPSRAALSTGMFGIHSGAINHGGVASELRPYGADRGFVSPYAQGNLFHLFRQAGLHTASFSTFAERHTSAWFTNGFNEVYNVGKRGKESAEDVVPIAMDWLERNAAKDDWFLHLNLWDPHTPYRAPEEFGHPFADEPAAQWIDEDVLETHLAHVGPHSINEIAMYTDQVSSEFPRHLGRARNLEEVKQVFDGYDTGIRYMDYKISKVIDKLKAMDLYEDLVIIITSDHGENLGELGLYAEHGTADQITTRIPMIIKWPGMKTGVDTGFHYNLDLIPTLSEILDTPTFEHWDGKSYAETLRSGADTGREYLVLSQNAHVCQRSVRFEDYIYIRTYHDGYHLFPTEMLFDLKNDYYEEHNLAEERPDLCAKACRYLIEWHQEMMMTSPSDIDPMWTVMREGGPFHAKGQLPEYVKRLRSTGRGEGAEQLIAGHPQEFK